MPRTARAIAWLLWQRNRWAFLALFGSGAVVALGIHLTVGNPPTPFTLEGAPPLRATFFAAALPLFFGLLYLMAAFAFPEADLAARHSGFPPHLLARPARTEALVFWPMLYGMVIIAAAWVAFARLVLQPNGMHVPLAWPAAMFAAGLACLQALTWSPMGLPYLRIILALLLLSTLATIGVVGSLNGVLPAHLIGGYGGVIALAGPAAVAGLSRARRGDTPEWHWWRRSASGAAAPLRRPFRSPAEAQLWFEWRRNGATLPLLMAGIGLLLTLPLAWMRDLTPWGAPGFSVAPGADNLELNLWVKLQQGCLFWPVILATIVGCGMRKPDTRHKDLSLPPFLATRPMSSTALVLVKLRMAAVSALAAWGVLLLFAWGWLLTPAREGARTGSLAVILLRHLTPETGLLAVMLLAVLVFWTWRNQVIGLAVELTGRPWLVHGSPVVGIALLLVALVNGVQWVGGLSGIDPRTVSVPWFVAWLVGAAVTVKALAAVWALRLLVRQRLMEPIRVAWMGAVWVLLVLALVGLLFWVARMGFLASLPLPPALLAPGYLVAVAVLFVPLTRLALGPVALAWNRHR
jgi:hypothetical protein